MTVGEFNDAYEEGYNCKEHFKGFINTSDAVEFAFNEFQTGDVILIKASRSMKFEKNNS